MADLPPEAAAAERAMLQRQLVLSDNHYQPKLVWTLSPWTRQDLQAAIEAGGASPFRLLEVMPMERRAILWAGAPHWAQYCYCVLVEVKAVGLG